MQNPTIHDLCRAAERKAERREVTSRALVPLNQSSERRTLYCVHAQAGTVFDYLPMARHLERAWDCRGILCRTYVDAAFRDTSIDQMVRDYCDLLRAHQPRGPYYLLGWCVGGMLAWLMASHLEAQGERVAFLGLVDPYLPRAQHTSAESLADDWRQKLKHVVARIAPAMTAQSALQEVQADPFTSQQALARVLETLFRNKEENLRREYAGMTSADLAGVILAQINLDQLEREYIAAPVRLNVDPYCWWAAGQTAQARVQLAHWTGERHIHHGATNASHESILSCDVFLESIAALTV